MAAPFVRPVPSVYAFGVSTFHLYTLLLWCVIRVAVHNILVHVSWAMLRSRWTLRMRTTMQNSSSIHMLRTGLNYKYSSPLCLALSGTRGEKY